MTYPLDDFWANVDAALTRCAEATTVEDVITILNEHFNPSSGAAFFGGSGGRHPAPRQALLGPSRQHLAGRPLRRPPYYWCLADTNGDLLTYIEGDVYRGNTMTD